MFPDLSRHPSGERSWIEIDLGAIRENVRRFAGHVGPRVLLMPAVKNNAYGHGAVPVGRAALAAGASRLAVATVAEGEELRRAGIEAPIHVLGAFLPEEVEPAIQSSLILSLQDRNMAQRVEETAAALDKTATVHLKVDTGMGRFGILPGGPTASGATIEKETDVDCRAIVDLARRVASLSHLCLEGVFSHFADALDEPYSLRQIAIFQAVSRALEAAGFSRLLRHSAASGAAILHPGAHFDMIRPGITMYGLYDDLVLEKRLATLPALAWRARIVALRDFPAGYSLGYGRTYVTDRPTRAAILPVGYGDGYIRALSNRGLVLIRGRRAPIVGRVCMDYFMVDVTGIDAVRPGDAVTLLGTDGRDRLRAETLADLAGTIPHEVVSNLGRRVARRYLNPSE
ncbi:MAG: alanine racemase [Planctomycetota bacterium]